MNNLPQLAWGAEALWRQLAPLLPNLSVEVVRHSTSTNTALLERSRPVPEADGGADLDGGPGGGGARVRRSVESAAFGRRAADIEPCLLVAEHQTGGRGRHGRSWQSAPGASLTFSLGLPLRTADFSGLSLAVGVAVCEALAAVSAAVVATPTRQAGAVSRLGLKWPNDLWLMDTPEHGRKLGGVLIESVAAGPARLVVIGIGLNVLALPPGAAPDSDHACPACVQELDPDATAPGTLARIAMPLVRALQLFEAQGFAPFARRYAVLDVLAGLPVRTTAPDAPAGIARGVSTRGELLVQTDTAAGGLVSVVSGEVSVRPAAMPPP